MKNPFEGFGDGPTTIFDTTGVTLESHLIDRLRAIGDNRLQPVPQLQKKLFVLDMMNLAFRAYHGFGRESRLTDSKGRPTFMCYGVATAIQKLITEYQPDYLIVAVDQKGRTFRHELYEGYKSNRGEQPEDLKAQLRDLCGMIEAYGFKTLRLPATEADDIIGTVATKLAGPDLHVSIVSGDKDYMQLVGPHVSILRPVNGGGYTNQGAEAVAEKFGCAPAQVVDCLALIGDAVDAVPGVQGIGPKGAERLIKAFGSLEGVYDNLWSIPTKMAQKLAKSQDMAFLSKKLVTIKTDLPLEVSLEECAVSDTTLRRPELLAWFADHDFDSLLVQSDFQLKGRP